MTSVADPEEKSIPEYRRPLYADDGPVTNEFDLPAVRSLGTDPIAGKIRKPRDGGSKILPPLQRNLP